MIGSGFSKNLIETTLTDYYANGGKGDKKLVDAGFSYVKSVDGYGIYKVR